MRHAKSSGGVSLCSSASVKKKEVQLFAETKELNFSGVLFKSLFLAEKNI